MDIWATKNLSHWQQQMDEMEYKKTAKEATKQKPNQASNQSNNRPIKRPNEVQTRNNRSFTANLVLKIGSHIMKAASCNTWLSQATGQITWIRSSLQTGLGDFGSEVQPEREQSGHGLVDEFVSKLQRAAVAFQNEFQEVAEMQNPASPNEWGWLARRTRKRANKHPPTTKREAK